MATPSDSEVNQTPGPDGAQRISYLDAGGQPAPRDTAEFALIRDFDERGNVISLMTERLTR